MTQLNIAIVLSLSSLYFSSCDCKSISLTPSNPSADGISIELLKGATDDAPLEWHLYAIDESAFNMRLHLDSSWSFHPTHSTSLTLEIGSDTANDSTPTSLIICFSQNNRTYFSTIIDIDGSDDALIYPSPSSPSSPKENYGTGRIEKLLDNELYGYFEPFISRPNISYPLRFTLRNYPDIDSMIFTYSNPTTNGRNIVYSAMNSNEALDIYIAAGNKGDNFDITYFNFIHSTTSSNMATTEMTETANQSDVEIKTVMVISSSSSSQNELVGHTLVIILIATIILLFCICIVFGIMFYRMYQNHKEIAIEKARESGKMEIIHLPSSNPYLSSGSNYLLPSFTTTSINDTCNETVLSIMSPGSTSNLHVVQDGASPYSVNSPNFQYQMKRDRLNTGELSDGEMDDDDDDALYDEPNKEDIRKATMDSGDTPGYLAGDINKMRISITSTANTGNTNRGSIESTVNTVNTDNTGNTGNRESLGGSVNTSSINNGNISSLNVERKHYRKTSSLVIEDHINTISMILPKLDLKNMFSGDSEALYEAGDDMEQTPMGNTPNIDENGYVE